MERHRAWQDESDDSDEAEAANRQTASLAGVAVTLLLLIIGLFLVQELRAKAAIEDCLLSGRRNCDIFVTQPTPWFAAPWSGIDASAH
jgi:hypothetical protein